MNSEGNKILKLAVWGSRGWSSDLISVQILIQTFRPMWSSSVYKKRWKKQAIFIPRQNASYTHLVNNIVYSNEAAKTIYYIDNIKQ